MLDVAHALDAARQHDVGGAGLDHHGSGDDGLQAAAAAPVDLEPRHAHGQACLEGGPPADARRLAARVGLGEGHVVDELGVDRGPV